MPTATSAPGNKLARARPRSRGFTIIELLIVVTLVAVSAGIVTLSLRDPAANQLEHEGMRLATLLEAARAESRAMAVPVRFVPGPPAGGDGGFHFQGLPRSSTLPQRWLDPEVRAEVVGARHLNLGPEPIIGAQRIVLRLHERSLVLATDGLAPFAPLEPAASAATP